MDSPLSYYSNKRQEVTQLLPPIFDNSRILEIGCGVGNFRSNIPQQCEYWGIEPAAAAASVAATKISKVIVGTYREVYESIPNSFFDCVICCDVIEHMDDHDWFFQSIKEKMKKDAVIVASIPNVRFVTNIYNLLVLRDWKYVDSGILDRTHLRFFTEKSLKRSLKENGYSISEFQGIHGREIYTGTLKDIAISVGAKIACCIIGWDSNFPQFAFRATPC